MLVAALGKGRVPLSEGTARPFHLPRARRGRLAAREHPGNHQRDTLDGSTRQRDDPVNDDSDDKRSKMSEPIRGHSPNIFRPDLMAADHPHVALTLSAQEDL